MTYIIFLLCSKQPLLQLSSEYFDKANDVYWKYRCRITQIVSDEKSNHFACEKYIYRNMINQMKKMLLDVAYRQVETTKYTCTNEHTYFRFYRPVFLFLFGTHQELNIVYETTGYSFLFNSFFVIYKT